MQDRSSRWVDPQRLEQLSTYASHLCVDLQRIVTEPVPSGPALTARTKRWTAVELLSHQIVDACCAAVLKRWTLLVASDPRRRDLVMA